VNEKVKEKIPSKRMNFSNKPPTICGSMESERNVKLGESDFVD
jgi:hypothetical protein